MREKPTNTPIILSSLLIMSGSSYICCVYWRGAHAHHVTKHNTPIHNILSTAPQLSISQKVIGTFPQDGNVMPKYLGATTHN
jgi:hypothetical protein